MVLSGNAWSPLAGGWLTGKYAAGRKSGGSLDEGPIRDSFAKIREQTDRIVEEVAAIGKEIGRSSAQVALAWLHHRESLVIPIIGARKLEQLKDNLASAESKLSPDQLERLENASKIDMGFPHDLFQKDNGARFLLRWHARLHQHPLRAQHLTLARIVVVRRAR